TGGGSTLHASLMRVGPSGSVIGLDKVERWVDHSNSELARCNVTNSKVHFMSASEMTFPNNHFDFAISGFLGWRLNFDFSKNQATGPDTVMNEIVRVLKPGGKVGISTWMLQEDTEWMERFVSSYSHPARRTYQKENEAGWEIILKHSGLRDTSILHEIVEFEYLTLDDWWDQMLGYGWRDQIESLAKKQGVDAESIKLKAFEKVEDYRTGEGVTFKRKVLYSLGTK
ncbi:MAG: methyltransferase domain-containing protein, partial [Candidatus Thorarchaeota archaeon]|nr:methyltransferase domain-containing protein [Candidatus Thorarchaeota archaeon]